MSVILFTGGRVWGRHPPGQTPPGQTPPRSRCPTPPGSDTPRSHPPGHTPRVRHPFWVRHHPPQEQTPSWVTPPRSDTPLWVRRPRVRHPPGLSTPPPKQTPSYGQRAAGTHPTGMHSCYFCDQKQGILVHVPCLSYGIQLKKGTCFIIRFIQCDWWVDLDVNWPKIFYLIQRGNLWEFIKRAQ